MKKLLSCFKDNKCFLNMKQLFVNLIINLYFCK